MLQLGPQHTPKINAPMNVYIYIYIYIYLYWWQECYVLINLKILCQTQRSFADNKQDDMKDVVSSG
jgi:hypothetical protein